MLKILGIGRSPRFSPNSVDRDTAIFQAVASKLSRKRLDVSIINEDLFIAVDLSEFDAVFSMARDEKVLTELAWEEEHRGLVVINSARSLLNMSRARIAKLFKEENLDIPFFELGNADYLKDFHPTLPVWIKRTDCCAQQKDDVCFAKTEQELQSILSSFQARGVKSLIAEQHIEGDLIKFYGVEGQNFFETFYPTKDSTFSKFGNETVNGLPQNIIYDKERLKAQTEKMARLTGYLVYGGDAIVMPNGDCLVIDFNDWPSFSSCRKEASKAIAQRFMDFLKN